MQDNQQQKEIEQIIGKIKESDSILIALSKNPSVDELATAMGLVLFIDKMGKHATAIYSGQTPNVLAFLNPEQKFETNTNGLQDFIIAINKEKADHLRYKLDGDYVKVYITPYRTTISENDLEFSHGDYNVNLVIALNVENTDDLDAALSEHGRIMHDAAIVNVTAGAPGKFGELQLADPAASSVAEIVTELVFAMQGDVTVDKEIATAFLTGIVAATERFSNNRTQPDTMTMAAKLMAAGADQQLISANIIKEEEPKAFEIERGENKAPEVVKEEPELPKDETVLDVRSMAEPVVTTEKTEEAALPPAVEEKEEKPTTIEEKMPVVEPTLPEVRVEPELVTAAPETPSLSNDVMAELKQMSEPKPEEEEKKEETTEVSSVLGKDYGSMIEEALSEAGEKASNNNYIGGNPALVAAPGVNDNFEDGSLPELSFDRPVDMNEENGKETQDADSYIADAPMKTIQPDGEQRMETEEKELVVKPEGLPLPDEEILPPPPAPPVDFSIDTLPEVQTPENQESVVVPEIANEEAPITPLGNSTEQEKMSEPESADASAFKIPGM